MRVTQSMLSNNTVRNLMTSYSKMGKLQEQAVSGKRINRPSDDPGAAMKSIGFRNQVDKIDQYKKNLIEVNNWLDSSEDALDGVGQVLQRAKYLVTNAANTGAMNPEEREFIKIELRQLQETIQDFANTQVMDKYIFSGTKTDTPLFNKQTKEFTPDTDGFSKDIEIEIFNGVNLKVNTNARDLFEELNTFFNEITEAGEDVKFDKALTDLDKQMDDVLALRMDIGGRSNRAELMQNRLDVQEASAKKLQSENEDIDFEKVITEMLTQEAVYRASLSVGARVIQPSLVDFLR
ncbi:flagellar hook-associated protein FlgL [Sporosarcina thermotolerans]|uniref:Flagellar hook-associated protein FlgL n=1 Tax=Sporosarcina thermotolerans TaxID=633404 RepID=A0AAW9A9A9_9BACL|nr:flagellar hook-associated protein FlgL [Sporosarcina thermotolerans]MDW0116940.1 flagellar hook-associated protein FlgL [Sporosarcina thermotolerans]WHT47944.1 flagellar hook-associated protein FlgL [Sporosarcina thermotolerans]